MQYHEYPPSRVLAPFIKCYYTITDDDGAVVLDNAFATGCIEVMFTICGTPWQVKRGDSFSQTSSIELWGQIVQPLAFRTAGKNETLGIRFYPATAALWLHEDINTFNEGVFNVADVLGPSANHLLDQLQCTNDVRARIALTDAYLEKRLDPKSKIIAKVNLVNAVMDELTHKDFFDNIENVARRYGVTSRYLQKLFTQHTGLTPKLHAKIHRFQTSLKLLGEPDVSLTAVAHDCGYYDQSHFIREFKSFTGFTPSAFTSATAMLPAHDK